MYFLKSGQFALHYGAWPRGESRDAGTSSNRTDDSALGFESRAWVQGPFVFGKKKKRRATNGAARIGSYRIHTTSRKNFIAYQGFRVDEKKSNQILHTTGCCPGAAAWCVAALQRGCAVPVGCEGDSRLRDCLPGSQWRTAARPRPSRTWVL